MNDVHRYRMDIAWRRKKFEQEARQFRQGNQMLPKSESDSVFSRLMVRTGRQMVKMGQALETRYEKGRKIQMPVSSARLAPES